MVVSNNHHDNGGLYITKVERAALLEFERGSSYIHHTLQIPRQRIVVLLPDYREMKFVTVHLPHSGT